MIKNIVFSGAGVKIYSFLGFIKALEEHNLLKNVESYIGTSAGSLIATLCVLDFRYNEIEEIVLKINTSNLKNITTDNIFNFFENYGLDNGDSFNRIIKIILDAKLGNTDITFKELYKITNKKLIVTATCVNTMEVQYFDHLGTPDTPIIKALMMSIAIPLLFNPIKIDNKYYVDGALIGHYPIEYFKDEKHFTYGILIVGKLNKCHEINNIKDYMYNILLCSYHNLIKSCYELYKSNTLLIETDGIDGLNFNIEYNTKISLIEDAYKKTITTINTDEFNTYFNL
jgi:NTE family protein